MKRSCCTSTCKGKEKALAAIDQAQTNNQVNQAATNGLSSIKTIQPETRVKPAAREQINQKANELRAQINQDKEATEEERQSALNKINELVNQAMSDISNDRTDQQVNDTTTQALDNIMQVNPEHIVRAAAREAVKQQYEAKSKKLSRQNTRQMKKTSSVKSIGQNEQQALRNIDQAVNNNNVKVANPKV